MSLDKRIKTSHAGAKRGKGAWCRKATAKNAARKLRRREDVAAVEPEYAGPDRRYTPTGCGCGDAWCSGC